MAATFEQVMRILSTDPWTGELLTSAKPDFSKVFALTCGDYQKWLRKQIRKHGRRFQIGDVQHIPVDMFVKEVTGFDFVMLAGGEVEVTANGETHQFMTDATTLAYYVYSDDGEMIVTAGKALDTALLEDASTLLIG